MRMRQHQECRGSESPVDHAYRERGGHCDTILSGGNQDHRAERAACTGRVWEGSAPALGPMPPG